jgi:hypothetical protein
MGIAGSRKYARRREGVGYFVSASALAKPIHEFLIYILETQLD